MKRFFVVLLTVVTLSSVMARAKNEMADDDYVIKIASASGLCSAPFFVAEEKGFYAEEGLKYEFLRVDSSQIPTLLATGQIDAMFELLATLVQPLSNGLDIKIPLAIHTGCIKVLVSPNSDIKTPADLKGKKIGTGGMAAPTTTIVQRYLARDGIGTIAPNLEVEWVIYPSSDLPMALERGLVDAIALGDPTALIIENAGKGRAIINTTTDDYMKDEFCCVLVAGSGVAKNHPETLAKMTRAIQKASVWVQNNPDATAQLLTEKNYIPGDPEVNAQALKSYTWDASVSAAKASLQRNLADMQKIGLIPQSVDLGDITNRTFLALPGVPDRL
jgi:NitT/TauT family transport system substrate-binding protein